ncbi:Cys-tRNA(Pro) deacylase [Novosphingobium flavum]|uniref:Cys-tRNA(Pro)/Cys-tRNA(Cys) deacylase n=1 Tax=Novosphingobium flavum TaxID=1778672 RepID=A0A7X1KNJ7_9SPHN|nr:Cys-tRNA(Pro) deacylase [Novosphingobium flavum]MBC2667425.1 Cys-tRNA(Pro) deacylase [Novosphingobium flavum]
MAKGTPATLALDKAGAVFTLHEYAYDPAADRVGLQAAEALGADPGEVFKTLMVLVDGKPACAILASDREAALKKVAAVLGGKSAQMMKPADAERLTGYKVGGISPFAQKRAVPTVLDAGAMGLAAIYLNGGRRGLQVRLAPDDAARLLGAKVAEIAA